MKIKKEKDSYDKQVAELQKNPEKATSALTEDLRKMRANLELEMQSAESYQMRAFQEFQAEYFPKIQKAAEAVVETTATEEAEAVDNSEATKENN